jgi:hypothetical protein
MATAGIIAEAGSPGETTYHTMNVAIAATMTV